MSRIATQVLLSHNSDVRFAAVAQRAFQPQATLWSQEQSWAVAAAEVPAGSLAVLQGSNFVDSFLTSPHALPRFAARPPGTVVVVGDAPAPPTVAAAASWVESGVAQWFTTNPGAALARHPLVHPYPRALQTHDGWASHLDGREARTAHRSGGAAALLVCCMKDRAGRAEKRAALATSGFKQGPSWLSKGDYIEEMLAARFVASPSGHGHTNHRDWEALTAGAVPVVDHHPALDPLVGSP